MSTPFYQPGNHLWYSLAGSSDISEGIVERHRDEAGLVEIADAQDKKIKRWLEVKDIRILDFETNPQAA